jgi:hypothetical protein
VVFYGILLLNTYYSVRCFAALAPPDNRLQRLIDLTLIGIYASLAASLGEPLRFVGTATVLFAVATLKYTVLIGRVSADALLARKLRVDALGTIACAWALGGMLGGHPSEAAWLLTGACAVANVYLLWVRPLYRSASAATRGAVLPSR